MKFRATTANVISIPGTTAARGWVRTMSLASSSMLPQLATAGGWPNPRKSSAASERIAPTAAVRRDVAQEDAPVRDARGARGVDVVDAPRAHHLAPGDARQTHPAEQAEVGDHQHKGGVAADVGDRDGEQEDRPEGQHELDEAHHQHVHPAAEGAGNQAVQGADGARHDNREEANQEA